MCGIVGIISDEKSNLTQQAIKGLQQLQNRGYDSAGYCYVENDEWIVNKKISSPDMLAIDYLKLIKNQDCNVCIAHNRWGTHGIISDSNAHPHLSYDEQLALVHNGIIENYL